MPKFVFQVVTVTVLLVSSICTAIIVTHIAVDSDVCNRRQCHAD